MPQKSEIKKTIGHQLVTLLTAGVCGTGLWSMDFFDYMANKFVEKSPVVIELREDLSRVRDSVIAINLIKIPLYNSMSIEHDEAKFVITKCIQGEMETKRINGITLYFNNVGDVFREMNRNLYLVYADESRDKVFYRDYKGEEREITQLTIDDLWEEEEIIEYDFQHELDSR